MTVLAGFYLSMISGGWHTERNLRSPFDMGYYDGTSRCWANMQCTYTVSKFNGIHGECSCPTLSLSGDVADLQLLQSPYSVLRQTKSEGRQSSLTMHSKICHTISSQLRFASPLARPIVRTFPIRGNAGLARSVAEEKQDVTAMDMLLKAVSEFLSSHVSYSTYNHIHFYAGKRSNPAYHS
jgi:hypothetical protein